MGSRKTTEIVVINVRYIHIMMKNKVISSGKSYAIFLSQMTKDLVSTIFASKVDLRKIDQKLRQGANPNVIIDAEGNTLLLAVIGDLQLKKKKEIIKRLIRSKADPSKCNYLGISPLQMAKDLSDEEVIALLLELGAETK